jgi:hypothetical protein
VIDLQVAKKLETVHILQSNFACAGITLHIAHEMQKKTGQVHA